MADLMNETCTTAATCGCPEHTSRVGDFSVDPSQPCEINTLVLQILWSLQSIFWLIFLILCLGTCVVIASKRAHIRRKFAGEQAILALKSTTAICFLIVGVLRTANTSGFVIGSDSFTTWIFCIGATTFWMDMLLFFVIQTNTHLISLAISRSERLAFLYKKIFPVLVLIACAGTFAPLGILYSNRTDSDYIYSHLHFILLGILIVVLITTLAIAMETVLKEIRFAMQSHDTNNSLAAAHNSTSPSSSVPVSSSEVVSSTASSTASGGALGPTTPVSVTPTTTTTNNNHTHHTNNRQSKSMKRDALIRSKLAQIEAQVLSFRRDSIGHLISGPISIAIGFSPFLTRYASYYLPLIWGAAGLGAIRYTAFSFSSIRATGVKGTSTMNSPSVQDSGDGVEGSDEGDAFPSSPAGLGISSSRAKRKKKWSAKMSKITELSVEQTTFANQPSSSRISVEMTVSSPTPNSTT